MIEFEGVFLDAQDELVVSGFEALEKVVFGADSWLAEAKVFTYYFLAVGGGVGNVLLDALLHQVN